jgi:hypothetical protein
MDLFSDLSELIGRRRSHHITMICAGSATSSVLAADDGARRSPRKCTLWTFD